jgi:hypothetical protein
MKLTWDVQSAVAIDATIGRIWQNHGSQVSGDHIGYCFDNMRIVGRITQEEVDSLYECETHLEFMRWVSKNVHGVNARARGALCIFTQELFE